MARWLKNDFKPGSKVPHEWLNTVANFWNGLTVTESDAVGLKRQSDGRNTEILLGNTGGNDTEGFSTDLEPDGRMTIEANPETSAPDDHNGERQLRNVNNVRHGSYSLPFFVAEEALQDNKIVGELYWAQVDANNNLESGERTAHKSIEIMNYETDTTKGKWIAQVYGFATANVCSVPYVTPTVGVAGTELIWRYPVAIAGAPISDETGTGIKFVTNITDAESPPTGESYVAIHYTYRTGTVHKGAINYTAGGPEETETKYITVDVNFEQIITNIESLIKHNSLDGTGDTPPWTSTNTGHDGRYLRIGADWAGDPHNNTCTGIANDTTGARAIDFASGYLIGDTYAEGATVDYGARKLYCYEGAAQVETADWQARTLSAASTAAPWKAVGAFRITVAGDPTKWIDFIAVGSGSLSIKNQAGVELARFDP
jgi:hypothetical protein